MAKAYFDVQEQEAWADYFENEVVARMYFPMWQLASEKYWEAYDAYNHLLDQKAELLLGYDEETKSKTTLDETFDGKAKLRIEVRVSGEVALTVSVAGRRASHTGGHAYAVSARGLKEGPKRLGKGLGLELEAR